MFPSPWHLRERKHWKLRLAAFPLSILLIAWGAAERNILGVVAFFLLITVTTLPYIRSDYRVNKAAHAGRIRRPPSAQ